MANRVPLVLDRTERQIEELPNGDSLDLTGNSIIGVGDITASGTVDATAITVNGQSLPTITFSGDYNDLTNKPTIPNQVSELANDVGYITTQAAPQTLGLVGSTLSISAGNSISIASIVPDNISAFANDSGYLTDISSESLFNLNDVELSLDSTAPTNGQALVYDSANELWTNGNILITETDTLDSVTTRGNTTTNSITVGGLDAGNLTVDTIDVTGTGTVTLEAATDLTLDAGNAVIVNNSPFRVASFSTAERDALTPTNGDIIYNTTTNKFQGYFANSTWADLH